MSERERLLDQVEELESTINAMHSDIDSLRAQLAATEVQKDAALMACREINAAYETYNSNECTDERLTKAHEACDAALALTTATAASIIAERDRLREACEPLICYATPFTSCWEFNSFDLAVNGEKLYENLKVALWPQPEPDAAKGET